MHQQGVAIGRRLRHDIGSDRPTRTGAVFDDHRLTQVFAQALTDHPCDHIGGAACRKGHHDFEWARRERLSP
jgi:hypothetical protein